MYLLAQFDGASNVRHRDAAVVDLLGVRLSQIAVLSPQGNRGDSNIRGDRGQGEGTPEGPPLRGARAVVEHRGPTYTSTLSGAEILALLAQRVAAPAESYPVPQVMGPVEEADPTRTDPSASALDVRQIAKEATDTSSAAGDLPSRWKSRGVL